MVTSSPIPQKNTAWLVCWYVLITATFVGLLVAGAGGVRGSDQYWNLGNVEQVMASGDRLTNCVYAGPILRGDYTLSENYFIHNTPTIYLAAFGGRFIGAYRAWLVMNGVASLLGAGLIAFGLQRLTTRWWAALGYAAYLLLPLTVWQTANVLQEAVYGLIAIALVVSLLLVGQAWWQWLLVSLLGCVAVFVHPVFMPVSMAIPLVFLWSQKPRLALERVMWAGVLIAPFVACYVVRDAVLPSTLPQGLSGIITGVIPGEGNMEWHLRKDLPEITGMLLLSKLVSAVKQQFSIDKDAIFFWPTNLLLALSVLAIIRLRAQMAIQRYAIAMLFVVAGFGFVLWMHQNQFRYGLFVDGVGVFGAMLALGHLARHGAIYRRLSQLVVLGLAGMLVIDVMLVRLLRQDGQGEAQIVAQIRSATESLPPDRPVVIEAYSSSYPLLLTYALQPRQCLLVDTRYLSAADLSEFLAMFEPVAAIAKPGQSQIPGTADAARGVEFAGGKYAALRLFPWSENPDQARPPAH